LISPLLREFDDLRKQRINLNARNTLIPNGPGKGPDPLLPSLRPDEEGLHAALQKM
jgi:hypothetical protein